MDLIIPNLLATVNGKDLVGAVLWIIAMGVCFWILWWLCDYVKIPEPFNKVVRVILAIAAAIFLINIIMGLVGEPFIKW